MKKYQAKEFCLAKPMDKATYYADIKNEVYAAVNEEGYLVRHLPSLWDSWFRKESFEKRWEMIQDDMNEEQEES